MNIFPDSGNATDYSVLLFALGNKIKNKCSFELVVRKCFFLIL